MFRVSRSAVLKAALACASLAACSSGSQTIDVPPTQQAGALGGFHGGLGSPAGDDASMRATLPASVVQYLDPNAKLTYTFVYGSANKNGNLTILGGQAELTLNGLPSGTPADMTLKIFQNNVATLTGTNKGVTLQSGSNNVTINMTLVSTSNTGSGTGSATGTGSNADLDLHISIAGGTDTSAATATGGSAGGTTGGNAGGTTQVRFADIQPLTVKYCGGSSCHGAAGNDATQETFWTTTGKANMVGYLSGTTGDQMPKGGLANVITAAERQQLLNYANNLQ